MKRTLFIALTVLAFTSCKKDDDNTSNSNSLNAQDQNFMTKAAYANHNEVDFARLAVTKSMNDSILLFAARMIAEHTAGLSGLDSLASDYHVTLPGNIDSAHAILKIQLASLNGYEFDSAYIHGQVNDHITTIALFQTEVASGEKQPIKDFANRTLPELYDHLEFADSVVMHLR